MPNRRAARFFAAAFALLSGATILALSLVPEVGLATGALAAPSTNWAHLPAYFLLSVLATVYAAPRSFTACARLGVLLIAFGAVVEVAQPLVGRSLSLMDLAFNVVGVVSGIALACLVLRLPAPRVYARPR